ncbi:family 1 glycosylhydrolase [Corynebacterium sp. TAE3-ERU12]|uniref:glycoside hydrolase family 1 protein n=1 Tax=Corynebacterium sp. TAE3-ERU12 TaxID=2849491 RepID=UPI001C443F7E|nr:family 1 glycosylhydrolase [Corynebacterium sp. TAE3-ERU12]MBV7294954.1 family 1 glycosylhydrolase [Corynebacterium sp. TAE3-ERU12]
MKFHGWKHSSGAASTQRGDHPQHPPNAVPITAPNTLAEEIDLRGIVLGTASAALQIEGGDRNNDWEEWSRTPGNIADGSSPVRATDHWNRWREDNQLMQAMGLRAARLGVEWARIEPSPGVFDHAAIDHYREEIGDLVDRNIAPLVTLHHFVNPVWFATRGGFTNSESRGAFLRYVRTVVDALGDLVTDWVTINEPNVYATQAHLFGEGPPANRSWRDTMRVLRHTAISHIGAYDLIHELQGERANVGFAHHARAFAPRNRNNRFHRATSAIARKLFQDIIAEAMLTGTFHPAIGGNWRSGVRQGRYYDYLGLNYYSRTAIDKLDDGTFPGVAVNDLGWEIYPQGLVDCARDLIERYDAPVWITENGTCDNGNPTTGQLERFRSRFIVDHLTAIANSGLDIPRYYHWCFVDNWEWNLGEKPRFGLVHLDYDTQQRSPKPSAELLGELSRTGTITRDLYARYIAGISYPQAPA